MLLIKSHVLFHLSFAMAPWFVEGGAPPVMFVAFSISHELLQYYIYIHQPNP